jgi:membrane protein required for colicin V production
MVTLDYIIIGIVLVSAVFGLMRGFLVTVCSLVTWVLAVWLSWELAPSLVPHLGGNLRVEPYGLWASRAIFFLAILVVGAIIGAIVKHFARLSLFSGTDRFLGFLLGLARGIVVLGVLAILGQSLRLDREGWWQHSRLAAQVTPVAKGLRALVGERLYVLNPGGDN